MDAGIWVAIITGICSVIGVVITVAVGNSKTLYRIEQLEKKTGQAQYADRANV